MAEKMRVHILARELNVSSKTIVEKCKAEGISSVKNHMSTLSAGLHATLREWFGELSVGTSIETSKRVDLEKVRLRKPRKAKQTTTAEASPALLEAEDPDDGQVPTAVEVETAAPLEVAKEAPSELGTETPPELRIETPAEVEADEARGGLVVPAAVAIDIGAPPLAVEPQRTTEPAVPTAGTAVAARAPTEGAGELEHATAAMEVAEGASTVAAGDAQAPAQPALPPTPTIKPAGPQNVPVPAKLRGPRVVRYEAPDHDIRPFRRGPRPRPVTGDVRPGSPGGPGLATPAAPSTPAKPAGKIEPRKGRFSPRRAAGRATEAGEKLAEWRDRDLAERQQRLAGATGRRIHRRRTVQEDAGAAARMVTGPKTAATVHEPIRMKEFCSETGLNFIQLFRVLKEEHHLAANVNMILAPETAQLLALHFGIDLTVVAAKTLLNEFEEESAAWKRDSEQLRPPVVTFLGHVDHGKTSLLDTIRKTQVVAGEDGGITQHIGSYHIETPQGSVTFLDTPGHEAFTAMRARGAQVTDVVVLVIAADDGVMPQTVEAIRHAQAAEVPIVVALNKIDLGDQNKLKIFGQLAEHGLTPSGDWGGEVDVIPTSAATGEGVDELVEHLADLSGLLELKADPTLPARGTVIEAETKPGVGPVARVLVQEGTLRVGAFIVCGNGFGKVRALVNDQGKRITQALPSIPVEVWGLDDVPSSGDNLYQLDSLHRAKNIAAEMKHSRLASGRAQSSKVNTLEEMLLQCDTGEVPELNVIIKADVDGSVAALQHALGKIPSNEVHLTIRHSGVGAVNDSDVLLAEACKGIVIAFRVDMAPGARRSADSRGVDIRTYRVIYDVCDEIKKALEGLLTPEERIESRAKAEVRQVFHITKLGMVAGSFVQSGTVVRNHLAKVIRDGVVLRDPCKFTSVRRFKEDVKEVRAGMECGIRLEGFDDLHVGDIIETYEILKIARTL